MSYAIIFDTETTSTKEGAEIIEAAYIHVAFSGDGALVNLRDFEGRYKPNGAIEYGAMAVHHIFDEELADCPPSNTFSLPDGVEYIIGHNVDFDWEMAGKPNIRRICTLALARKLYPELDSHTQSALVYYFSKDKAKARDQIRNAHSALPDVKMCMFVLQSMLKEKMPEITDFQNLWEASELARIPTVIPFGKHKGMLIKDLPSDYKQWLLRQDSIDPFMKKAIKGSM